MADMNNPEEQKVPQLEVEVEFRENTAKRSAEDSNSPSETSKRRRSSTPELQPAAIRNGEPGSDDDVVAAEKEEGYATESESGDEQGSAWSSSSDEEEAGAEDDNEDENDAFEWNDDEYGDRTDNTFVDTAKTHDAFGNAHPVPQDEHTTFIDSQGTLHRVCKSYVDGILRETDIWIDWQGIRHEVQSWRDASDVPRELRIWRDEQCNQHRLMRWLDADGKEKEQDDWISPEGVKHTLTRWKDDKGTREEDVFVDKNGIKHEQRFSRDEHGNKRESDRFIGRDGYQHQVYEIIDEKGNHQLQDMWRDGQGVERVIRRSKPAHGCWRRMAGTFNLEGQFVPTYVSGREYDGEYTLNRADGTPLHPSSKASEESYRKREELAKMPPHVPNRPSRLAVVESVEEEEEEEAPLVEKRFSTSGGFDWSKEEPDEYDIARFEQAKEDFKAENEVSPVVSPVDDGQHQIDGDAVSPISPVDGEEDLFGPTASGISFERPVASPRTSVEDNEEVEEYPLRADTPFPETEEDENTEATTSDPEADSSEEPTESNDIAYMPAEEGVDIAHQWWEKANSELRSKAGAAERLRMKRAILKEQSPEAAWKIDDMNGDVQATVHILQADRFRFRWQRNYAMRKADERVGEERERAQRQGVEIERLEGELDQAQAHEAKAKRLEEELTKTRLQTQSLITQVQTVADEAVEVEIARGEKYKEKAKKLEEITKSWIEQAESYKQWGEENAELANAERSRRQKSVTNAETQTPAIPSCCTNACTETGTVVSNEVSTAAESSMKAELAALSQQLQQAKLEISNLKEELENRPPPIRTSFTDRKSTLHSRNSSIRIETWKEREARLRATPEFKAGQEAMRIVREAEAKIRRERMEMIVNLEYVV